MIQQIVLQNPFRCFQFFVLGHDFSSWSVRGHGDVVQPGEEREPRGKQHRPRKGAFEKADDGKVENSTVVAVYNYSSLKKMFHLYTVVVKCCKTWI